MVKPSHGFHPHTPTACRLRFDVRRQLHGREGAVLVPGLQPALLLGPPPGPGPGLRPALADAVLHRGARHHGAAAVQVLRRCKRCSRRSAAQFFFLSFPLLSFPLLSSPFFCFSEGCANGAAGALLPTVRMCASSGLPEAKRLLCIGVHTKDQGLAWWPVRARVVLHWRAGDHCTAALLVRAVLNLNGNRVQECHIQRSFIAYLDLI